MPGDWIDISTPMRSGMPVWPGDPETRIEQVQSIERGDSVNVSAIAACLHAGTHVDAPLHYFAKGGGIETMPLNALVGPARVVAIEDLERQKVERGERVLVKARGAELALESARLLTETCAVGIEGMSIGSDDVHRLLLGAGVWILEGLDLSAVEPGPVDLIALPLRIPGADGAPARAIVRPR